MRIDYVLRVEAEYHIGTGLSRPGVVDETLVCRPDGSLFIPAEYFRGLLRDCCTQILYWTGKDKECCEASLLKAPTEVEPEFQQKGVPKTCGLNFRIDKQPCVLCRIFGTTFSPKAYRFTDAVFEKFEIEGGEPIRISTHNRIDPATGRVPQDFLFSFELGAPAIFKGGIERIAPSPDPDYPDLLLEEVGLIVAGMRLVERVGKRSARGWGWARIDEINLTFSDDEKGNLPTIVKDAPECWKKWLKAFMSCQEGEESEMGASKC